MQSDDVTLNDCERASIRLANLADDHNDSAAPAIKSFLGVNLFFWHLSEFAKNTNPLPAFIRVCEAAERMLQDRYLSTSLQAAIVAPCASGVGGNSLYSNVYSVMSDHEYFNEARIVLRRRLEANAIKPEELFDRKIVLDAGCGGGKFTQAIANFGAARVVGVDIEEGNVNFARQQALKAPYGDRLQYCVGSLLSLPVNDSSVDFVWCNSVAHLTGNQDAALAELSRVLKSGGTLYYYVNGRFGLYEILLKLLVRIMKGVPAEFMQHFLQSLGIGPGRISWIIACMFAPYEFISQGEIEKKLAKNGFTIQQRLGRGIDDDYSEKISRDGPFARLKYGDGQLKYLARKNR